MKKSLYTLLILLLAVMLVAACGKGGDNGANPGPAPSETDTEQGNENAAPPKNTDPVTLTILTQVALTDEEFKTFIEDPVKAENPHISFELIRQTPELTLDDLIVAGQIPDMIYGGPNLFGYLEKNYPADLSEAIKQYDLDISKISPNVMDSIKLYSENDEIYGMPFTMNAYALFYNKGIFDLFGVNYPTDGMTWDEAIELGRQVTKVEDGIQYRGIDIMNTNVGKFAEPLGIELVDRENMKPIVSDKWQEVFSIVKRSFDIPGNDKGDRPGRPVMPWFTQDQTLAMGATWTNGMVANLPNAEGLDWDIAQLPSFPEKPNTYIQADFAQFVVSQFTNRLDAVMEVLKVAISEETQVKATRMGRIAVLKDTSITDQFAANIPAFQGKNVAGIFKSDPAERLFQDEYYNAVFTSLNAAFMRVYRGEADINTALRDAEDEARQKFDELMAASE